MPAIPSIDFHCHSVIFLMARCRHRNCCSWLKLGKYSSWRSPTTTPFRAYSPQLLAAAATAGITLVNGCEISCQWQRRGIHVVGLNLDLAAPGFALAMTLQAQTRHDRAEKIRDVLQRLGLDVALPQVQALAGDGVIGRPHFAQHLVSTNQMPSMAAAFKCVLGSGKPGDIKADWPTLETAVGWITDAGVSP